MHNTLHRQLACRGNIWWGQQSGRWQNGEVPLWDWRNRTIVRGPGRPRKRWCSSQANGISYLILSCLRTSVAYGQLYNILILIPLIPMLLQDTLRSPSLPSVPCGAMRYWTVLPAWINTHDIIVVLIWDLNHFHGLGSQVLILRTALTVLEAQLRVQILHQHLAFINGSGEKKKGRNRKRQSEPSCTSHNTAERNRNQPLGSR